MTINPQPLETIEFASRDEIEALQLTRLKWTLHHAYDNVPMYKRKFDQAGVHPDDLKQLSDLARFPTPPSRICATTTHSTPSRCRWNRWCASTPRAPPAARRWWVTPSATSITGPISSPAVGAGGATAKDKVHVAYGYGLFTGGLGAHYGAERLGATVIPMSGGQTERQAQLILDFKPDIIMVTPSYCLTLIDELERKMGGDARGCSLRLGVFGAEPWTEALRHEIETRMGIKALDIYGLSEVMGPGVAMECLESGGGPTIWEDHFLPEIICPETGVALPDGEHGELVFTTLTKEALPVIRYRTRDLTRLLPGDARQMRRMGKITGRSDDMLIIRGVNVFPSQVEEQIMQFEQLSPHYQLQVSRSGHLDTLAVRVELKESALSLSHQQRCDICHQLRHHIKSIVGVSTDVSIANCGDIPRSEGKAQRVVDLRPR